jgi:phosphoribosylanthranilate isomerase
MTDDNVRRRTRVKFCGMQTAKDVAESIALGVDAVGFIFAPSPRQITLEHAVELARSVPPLVSIFGVLVDPSAAEFAAIRRALPHFVPQFCGHETPEFCQLLADGSSYAKVLHVEPGPTGFAAAQRRAAAYTGLIMFDTAQVGRFGGTGAAFDWSAGYNATRPFLVAGGLHSENVGNAVLALRPYGVDVRSGIESEGRKDLRRMQAFIAAVRQADEEIAHGTH